MEAERFDTVVIGAGQAGLTSGYHLRRAGRSFVILDAHDRVGDNWRERYDSLHLFTPAFTIDFPGMRFPLRRYELPTKDQMADFLEAYVERFSLPVRTGIRVDAVRRDGDTYVVTAGELRFEAWNVVVAAGTHTRPRQPAFSRELDPSIVQLHSTEYRNPSQLREGSVLVVGAGNSGADISLEVSSSHETWLSGEIRGHVPVDIDRGFKRHLGFPVVLFLGKHVLTIRTPLGRRAKVKFASQGDPLVRVKPTWLDAAGVRRVGKTVAARDGKPVLEDGSVLDVANVIWCTGSRGDFTWLDLPIFGEDGEPMHERGVVGSEPGLYFVGLPFQYAKASEALPGVARDAAYVVRAIGRRSGARTRTPEPVAA
jgi:putative flavoprotein involved in K+ transport